MHISWFMVVKWFLLDDRDVIVEENIVCVLRRNLL